MWQTGTEHGGGCMPIAIAAMLSHAIGPRDMSIHTRHVLHESSKRFRQRTFGFGVDILMR